MEAYEDKSANTETFRAFVQSGEVADGGSGRRVAVIVVVGGLIAMAAVAALVWLALA